MKLFFLILLTLASVNMSARENGEVVISAKTGISNSHQKTNIPKAYYSDDDGVLEIEFESDQEVYLEVSDENGNLVYCSTINTDGNANYFKLDLDQKHNYTITITSVNETYIGEIEAERQ
jgi:hypothetical protein